MDYANQKNKSFSDITFHHIIKSWLKNAENFIISGCIFHSGQMFIKWAICVSVGKLMTSDDTGQSFLIFLCTTDAQSYVQECCRNLKPHRSLNAFQNKVDLNSF